MGQTKRRQIFFKVRMRYTRKVSGWDFSYSENRGYKLPRSEFPGIENALGKPPANKRVSTISFSRSGLAFSPGRKDQIQNVDTLWPGEWKVILAQIYRINVIL